MELKELLELTLQEIILKLHEEVLFLQEKYRKRNSFTRYFSFLQINRVLIEKINMNS